MKTLNKKSIIITITCLALIGVTIIAFRLRAKPTIANSTTNNETSTQVDKASPTKPSEEIVTPGEGNKNNETTSKANDSQNETSTNNNTTQQNTPSVPSTTPPQTAPAETSPLIGRNAVIKSVKLKPGEIPVIDPILQVNVLGFEKGTGTVRMATFKDAETGKVIANPVIVPDGKPNEAVYVSFYRMQNLQESFIGKHVVWYNSISSSAKTFPYNYKEADGSFATLNNNIYLIDYIYVK